MFINSESGQSTVEFVLTFILFISFTMFFFRLSLWLAYGSYVHYATFMSARAFMSSSDSLGDQKQRARYVIINMLKKSIGEPETEKFPFIAKGVSGTDPSGFNADSPSNYSSTDNAYSWLQGVRYTFRSKLFILPLAGLKKSSSSGSANASNAITLTSESWLGRESSDEECRNDMGKASWIFDNGC